MSFIFLGCLLISHSVHTVELSIVNIPISQMENTEAWRKTCFFFLSTRVEGIPSMCQVWGPTDLWACPFQVSVLRWWPPEGQRKPSPEKGARALGILAVSPEIRVLWSLGYFISQGIPFRLTGRLTTSSGAVQSALKHITCWWTQDLLGSTNRSLKKRSPLSNP